LLPFTANKDKYISQNSYLTAVGLSQAAPSRSSVNSHWLSQWEPSIFESPQNRGPSFDR